MINRKLRIEFKIEDCWIGAFWKSNTSWIGYKYDLWVCIIPCFPIHYTYRDSSKFEERS